MAVTYKGEHRGGNTVSIPHSIGDLLLVTAFSNSSVPSLATGYTNLTSITNLGGLYARSAYKYATSTSESMDVWSGYSFLTCKVFSGVNTASAYAWDSNSNTASFILTAFNSANPYYSGARVAVFDVFYSPWFSTASPQMIVGGPTGATQYAANVPISSGISGYYSYQSTPGVTQSSSAEFIFYDNWEVDPPILSTGTFNAISTTIQLDGSGGFRIYYTTG